MDHQWVSDDVDEVNIPPISTTVEFCSQIQMESESNRTVLQCQRSSVEESPPLHPLRSLLISIQAQVDRVKVHQLICLSKKQLGSQFDTVVKDCDLLSFFDALESKYGTENAVNYMEKIFEDDNLHGDFGSEKLSEKIAKYKKERANSPQECFLDPSFVGRKQVLSDIMETLESPTNDYTGVVIYGPSGVGKSSLAREVCHKLQRRSWRIIPINLRSPLTLQEVFHTILLHVPCNHWKWGLENELLQSEVMKALKRSPKNIIWLNNLEIQTANVLNLLLDFVMQNMNTCQTKFLFTLTEETSSERHNLKLEDLLRGDFKIEKLENLSLEECNQLLKKLLCSVKEDDENRIYDFTGGNPLALKIVGTLLNSGTNLDKLVSRTNYSASEPNGCIDELFQSIDEASMELLLKLSLFNTAPFCLEDVRFVRADVKSEKAKKNLLMKLTHLKLSSIVVKEYDLSCYGSFRGTWRSTSSMFSIHPCILAKLKVFQKSENFQAAKVCFCKHFCSIINRFIKELDSKTDDTARIIWYKNWIHFKTWFHYVMSDMSDPIRTYYNFCRDGPLLCQYRIWRVALNSLDSSAQQTFLRKHKCFANASDNHLLIMWIIFQAEYYIKENQIEMAAEVIDELPDKVSTLLPQIRACNASPNCSLSNFKYKLKTITTQPFDGQLTVIVLNAFYCRVIGKLLLREENLRSTAIDWLRLSLHLFSGKYGSAEIQKEIKQTFQYEAFLLKRLIHVERSNEVTKDVINNNDSESTEQLKSHISNTVPIHPVNLNVVDSTSKNPDTSDSDFVSLTHNTGVKFDLKEVDSTITGRVAGSVECCEHLPITELLVPQEVDCQTAESSKNFSEYGTCDTGKCNNLSRPDRKRSFSETEVFVDTTSTQRINLNKRSCQ